jgi:hypothetical protein
MNFILVVDILLHVLHAAAAVLHDHDAVADDDACHRPTCRKERNPQKSEAAEKQKSFS